jgi:membrane associated rhomboid family serine protease
VCPKCKRPLTAIRVGGPEGCELDQCDRCGGVWFDRGEWEHLECLQTFQAYQQDLQRPTSWAEWSFQFFLRLPIEFNVAVRRFPMVTVVMITFCVIIFLAQLAVGQDHWQVFATYSTRIWHGQGLYALITSNFLHGGVLHLAGNMYFLYILGDNVEDALGRWRYTLLFLGSAVASDLMHVVVFPNSNVPLLGASGGVLGVMAAYLLLFPRARLTIMLVFWQFKVKSWVWVGFYLLVQVVGAILTLPGQPGEVAYWGHLGGFIAGVLFVWPQRHALVEKHPLLRLLHHYRAPANRSRASTVESS